MKQTKEEWARYIQDEIHKNDSYDNYKPQNTKINLEKMYKTCYLVDCPMHQKLD